MATVRVGLACLQMDTGTTSGIHAGKRGIVTGLSIIVPTTLIAAQHNMWMIGSQTSMASVAKKFNPGGTQSNCLVIGPDETLHTSLKLLYLWLACEHACIHLQVFLYE